MSLLKETHPEIFNSIDKSIDYGFDVNKISTRSSQKVIFICEHGHHHEGTPAHRTRGHKCPICTRSASVRDTFPELCDYLLHKEDTNKLLDCTIKSSMSFLFVCPLTEETLRRTVKLAMKYFHKDHLKELQETLYVIPDEYKSTDETYPPYVYRTSKTVKKWTCSLGHNFTRTIGDIVGRDRGCPYCRRQKLLTGFNDVKTMRPDFVQFWDEKTPPEGTLYIKDKKYHLHCRICNEKFLTVAPKEPGYGNYKETTCPYCTTHRHLTDRTALKNVLPTAYEWFSNKNTVSKDSVNAYSRKKFIFTCDKGHEFFSRVDMLAHRGGISCPKCPSSLGEKELIEFLESIMGSSRLDVHNRTVLDGKELDIYIPDKKFAIEYNGLYWHNEDHDGSGTKNKSYQKFIRCRELGISLFTISEADWRDKKDIIKSMIRHKLGMSTDARIYARNTTVKEISYQESAQFLNKYHLQGKAIGNFHVGLFHGDDLVAVSTWRKNKNVLYLDRYATSCIVVGGMGKLLACGKQYARDNQLCKIITFSDNSYATGDMYNQIGFTVDKELYSDYKYVVGEHLVHKFNYRKKRFRTDPNLIYKEGLTEKQLAEINMLPRQWDCGKIRWILPVEKA